MEIVRFYTSGDGQQYVLSGHPNAFGPQKTSWWLTRKGCTVARYCFSTQGAEALQEKEVASHMANIQGYISLFENTCKEKKEVEMRATGAYRRIDDLGRIVIPKELRVKLCISEDEPLAIYAGEDFVAFKKYDASRNVKRILGQLQSAVEDEPGLEAKAELLQKLQEFSSIL